MDGSDAPKAEWVIKLPGGPPAKEDLACLVDADGGRDDAENSYYEAFADPDFVRIETAQRRFRGQYLRRLRTPSNTGRPGVLATSAGRPGRGCGRVSE